MDHVLIDSSAWIEALRTDGDEDCRELVSELLLQDRAAVCEVVVAEVLRGAANRGELDELGLQLGAVPCLSMTGAGLEGGELSLRLRRRGRAIPTTDLLIAATASIHGASLLHRDKHLDEAAQAAGVQVIPTI